MPTTKMKNLAYRLALPIMAPRTPARPVHLVSGRPLNHAGRYARLLRRHHVQGASTLFASGEDCSLALSHGSLPGHEAREDTWYRVASITKMAATLACLRLCALKQVPLDAPAAELLGEAGKACPELQGVTLRHLLSHTAGLQDPPDLEQILEAGVPFSEVMKKARFASPGTAFRYSNLGFGLVGSVLESLSGEPVDRALRQLCFDPLGLEATVNAGEVPPEKIMPITRILPFRNQHLRVTPLGSREISGPDPARHYGYTAGSMYITVQSLFALMRFFRDGRPDVLPEELRREMLTQQAEYGPISPTLSYGLGMLFIRDPALSSGRIVGHQGFAYGCADGAFFEEDTGRILITLNGGASEARQGRLGLLNRDLLRFAFQKEVPSWKPSQK